MNEMQGLFSRLRVTTVTDIREFRELTQRNSEATDWGRLQYGLRDPSRAAGRPKLSVMANDYFGGTGFSYNVDYLGKHCLTLQPLPHDICLTKIVSGRFEVREGAEADDRGAGPGGLLVSRFEPGTVCESSDDCARINLWLRGDRVTALLERLLGHRVSVPLRFAPPGRWPGEAARSLVHAVDYVTAELASPTSLFGRGIGVPLFEEMLFLQLLRGVPHNHSEALSNLRSVNSAGATRRAEAYVRANLQRSLTVEEIASASGASVRSLLKAFRRDRGTTVVTFLRDLRLDASRADLLAGAGTVAAVAGRYNFSNVGRFSAFYRKRFGESPAETLGKPSSPPGRP